MSRKATITRASEVAPTAVRWLWRPYVPLGKVTVHAGPPGQGKSQLALWIAAAATRGDLDGDLRGQPTNVLIASAEDDPADTIVPRLMAADADRVRVAFLDMRTHVAGEAVAGNIALPGDGPEVRRAVEAHAARLLVLDPITAALDGRTDSWKGADVRAALGPLVNLARDLDCAVLALTHLNKGNGNNPLARIADSEAFTQLARSVLLQGADPSDSDGERGTAKVVAVAKTNLAERGQHALALRLESATVATTDGQTLNTSRIVAVGATNVTAADLLNVGSDGGALAEARAFLRDELADGPQPARVIKEAAESAGIAAMTLRRAREMECDPPTKRQGDGLWEWRLIEAQPERDPHRSMSTLNKLITLPVTQPDQRDQGDQDDHPRGGQGGRGGTDAAEGCPSPCAGSAVNKKSGAS